jgi:mannosyltransferase OCH1-like enzyme
MFYFLLLTLLRSIYNYLGWLQKEVPKKTLEKHLSARRPDPYPQLIPKILHQTHETQLVPESLHSGTISLIDHNPEYEYRFYTAKDRENFILQYFGVGYLELYLTLRSGTFRADFFRYCVLYIYGGIYIDCKSISLKPFREFIPSDASFCGFRDLLIANYSVQSGFIAVTAQNPLIKSVLDQIVKTITQRKYGFQPLDVTSSMAMQRGFNIMLGKFKYTPLKIKRYTYNGNHYDIIGYLDSTTVYFCRQHEKLIIRCQKSYYTQRTLIELLESYA